VVAPRFMRLGGFDIKYLFLKLLSNYTFYIYIYNKLYKKINIILFLFPQLHYYFDFEATNEHTCIYKKIIRIQIRNVLYYSNDNVITLDGQVYSYLDYFCSGDLCLIRYMFVCMYVLSGRYNITRYNCARTTDDI